jgi:hypothetical protein
MDGWLICTVEERESNASSVAPRVLASHVVSAPLASIAAPESSAPALVTAAESFLRTHSGETVEGVVAQRALGHYWESIRQYLTIRVGPPRALEAMRSMSREADEVGSLLAPPGPRARLFRAARAHLDGAASEAREVAWWEPPDPTRAARLRELRATLDAEARELIVLRYPRALSTDELAFVLARPL